MCIILLVLFHILKDNVLILRLLHCMNLKKTWKIWVLKMDILGPGHKEMQIMYVHYSTDSLFLHQTEVWKYTKWAQYTATFLYNGRTLYCEHHTDMHDLNISSYGHCMDVRDLNTSCRHHMDVHVLNTLSCGHCIMCMI